MSHVALALPALADVKYVVIWPCQPVIAWANVPVKPLLSPPRFRELKRGRS